jgi:hypothetical protein
MRDWYKIETENSGDTVLPKFQIVDEDGAILPISKEDPVLIKLKTDEIVCATLTYYYEFDRTNIDEILKFTKGLPFEKLKQNLWWHLPYSICEEPFEFSIAKFWSDL